MNKYLAIVIIFIIAVTFGLVIYTQRQPDTSPFPEIVNFNNIYSSLIIQGGAALLFIVLIGVFIRSRIRKTIAQPSADKGSIPFSIFLVIIVFLIVILSQIYHLSFIIFMSIILVLSGVLVILKKVFPQLYE